MSIILDKYLLISFRRSFKYKLGKISLAICKLFVLDEVDILLENHTLSKKGYTPFQNYCSKFTRFIFATSMVTKHFDQYINNHFANFLRLYGKGLHCTLFGLNERVIDCSCNLKVTSQSLHPRKKIALLSIIQSEHSHRTLIFCNQIETCEYVRKFLLQKISTIEKKSGIRKHILSLHDTIHIKHQYRKLKIFLEPRSLHENLILICTDKISRGLDTVFAEHVIIYDFPRNPSEYFRRVGRTSRGPGGKGKVTILATNEQVVLAREITLRNRMGIALHEDT